MRSLTFDPAERPIASSPAPRRATSTAATTAARAGATPASSCRSRGWVVGTLRFDPNRPDRLWAGALGNLGRRRGRVLGRPRCDLGVRAEGLPAATRSTRWRRCRAAGPLVRGTRAGVWRTDDAAAPGAALGARPAGARSTSRACWSIRAIRRGASPAPGAAPTGATTAARPGAASSTAWCSTPRSSACTPVPGRPGELWASTCGWVYRGEDLGERWTRFKDGLRRAADAELRRRALAGAPARRHRRRALPLDRRRRTFRRTADRAGCPMLAIAAHPRRPSASSSAPRAPASGSRTTAARRFARAASRHAQRARAGARRGRRAAPRRRRPRRPALGRLQLAEPRRLVRADVRPSCRPCSTLALAGDRALRRHRARPLRALGRGMAARWPERGLGSGWISSPPDGSAPRARRVGRSSSSRARDSAKLAADLRRRSRAPRSRWGDLWIRTAAGLWRAPSERSARGRDSALATTPRSSPPATDGSSSAGDEGSSGATPGTRRGVASPGRARESVTDRADGRFPLPRSRLPTRSRCFDGRAASWLPIASEFPAGSALSALVAADRLLVRTLRLRTLEQAPADATGSGGSGRSGDAGGSAAPDAEALTQSSASEARMRR